MPLPQAISPTPHLRTRLGRVCVALQATTPDGLIACAEAALHDSHFVEFRLDSLPHPETAIAPIAAFLAGQRAYHGDLAAIATCRRKPHGGGFSGTLAAELQVLIHAAEAGFALIDLEIESAEQLEAPQWLALRETLEQTGAALQISFHDFAGSPDPEAVFTRIQRYHPEFIKVVTTARSLTDSLNLLNWIRQRSGNSQLIGIAMGEPGIVSRVLSLRAGSAYTFAAPEGNETAPGQMSAHTLKELYRIEEIDTATRIYGVAGNPVAHSLSPLMQNTAFRRERINAVYLPLKTEKLDDLLTLARQLPLSGLSITMPLKQAVLAHLANVDPLTAKLGACNTVRLGVDGKLYGFNTDVAGIIRPLEKRLTLRGARILVLGSGGAARAAVYGLCDKGAEVFVWTRDEAKARDLAADSGARSIPRAAIAATAFDVLINATPCGMTGHAQSLPLKPGEWHARLVFDLVYNPLDTPLLQEARSRNVRTIQGFEMFVHQGARQFELWTGKAAPEAEMLRVVLHSLTRSQQHAPAVTK